MSSAPTVTQRVYASLWHIAAPVSLAGEPAGETCRALAYPTAALARLSEDFLEAELIAAGVAVREADGAMALASALAAPEQLMTAVRADGGEPIDLVTERGALSGAMPAVAMLADRGLQEILPGAEFLVLVFSFSDVAWLRAAGVPVLLCPSADLLTAHLVWHLHAALRDVRNPPAGAGSAAGDAANATSSPSCPDPSLATSQEAPATARPLAPPTDAPGPGGTADLPPGAAGGVPCAPLLVLAAFSPSGHRPDPPPGLPERLAELARVQRALPFDFPPVCVWSPAEEELRKLSTIRQYGSSEQWRSAVLETVHESGRMLGSIDDRSVDVDYLTARSNYRRALECPATDVTDTILETAGLAYSRAVERELVEPLLQRGSACGQPDKRALYAAMAEVCRAVQHMAPHAWRDPGSAQPGPPGRRGHDFLTLIKLLVAIKKELG